MKINYNYLPQEFENVEPIISKWRELIKTTDFTLGSYVEEFENEFKNFVGAKHCISTNNGTDALILCLKSLGICKGDEVITVANTFYATVGAIVAVGAHPVLVDSDNRYQIDVNKVEAAINKSTKAIMPVHWGGASPNMDQLLKICDKYDILMIEDACMGIGGSINGKHPGTFGKANAFSMHPLKSLNVMGDGGMVVTDDDEVASWMKKYRNHGMIDRDHIEFWGVNMRLQPLQAIVAQYGLKKLKNTIDIRNKNAKILDDGLSNLKSYVDLPPRIENNIETFALYMACFEKRDDLKSFLEKSDIEVKIHYPVPLHKQIAGLNCTYDLQNLKNVDKQSNTLLTIPVHQFLTDQNMHFVLNKIFKFYGKKYEN